MNYHNITVGDMANGMGIRVVLWLSGCSHACKNCHNKKTWDPNSGIPFNKEDKEELFNALDSEYITGLTLSGGDPLYMGNRDKVLELLKEYKNKFPSKDVWLYTGYKWEVIKDLEIMKYINVLVDGKYDESLSSPSPQWRGSTNQRVIDVKESLKANRLIII